MPATTKGDFLLRVKGESMIEAGILDGDLVIVQRAQDARNGEIVVALAGDDESADEATVKTFYREKGRVRLQPENSSMEPIYAEHVADPRPRRGGLPGAVVGALTALHRSLDQELVALLRGASLECLACGEFVMHAQAATCSARSAGASSRTRTRSRTGYHWACRPGDRGRRGSAEPRRSRKVRTPKGRTLARARRRKPTESGTERTPPLTDLRRRQR